MEWRVHIGAHKTATTHLQDSLAVVSTQLKDFGVCFVPREQSRPMLARGRSWAKHPRWNHLHLYRLRYELIRRARGCARLVISEENLLGKAADCLRSPLYPNAESGLALLGRLKRNDKLTLYLSIRGFDEIAPGAYATALWFKSVVPEDKERFIADVKRQPPRWVHLIDRLLESAPPNTELKVWRHQDYVNDWQSVLSMLVGDAAPIVPNVSPPKLTVTPSNEAVSAVEKLYREFTPRDNNDWMSKVNELYSQHPVNSDADKFNFLDPETVEILRATYHADCQEILDRWPDAATYI
jgi:hypothetical protein